MHIQSDRAFVAAGAGFTRYLSVTITAPPAPAPAVGASKPARPGVRVSIVLDRSGSMEGRKFTMAQQAVACAIRLLKGSDDLCVVVCDDEVETVLEPVPATGAAKQRALAALRKIGPGGSTNLSGGWWAGARALGASGAPEDAPGGDAPSADAGGGAGPAKSVPGSGTAGSGQVAVRADGEGADADRVSRVLLLTDGLANQGVTDPGALRQAAARYRAQGIGTTTFGLGADFDEELLTAIATQGGGHFYFIEQAGQIPDLLASELGEVLDVVARDVALDVAAGPGVSVSVLNGLPVERAGDVTRVRLGDLVADQDITLLLAVTSAPRAEGERAWVDCRLRDRDQVLFPAPMRVEWTAVPAEQDRQQCVNRDVILAVAGMLAETARARALAANRLGAWDQAASLLREAADDIRHLAGGDPGVEAIAASLVQDEDDFAQPMNAMELKSRHFASYGIAYSRERGGQSRRRR